MHRDIDDHEKRTAHEPDPGADSGGGPTGEADGRRDGEEPFVMPDEPDAEWDDDDGAGPPAWRRWIRNTVMVLVACALIGNILAFWPRIYNLESLRLIFQSRDLSAREDVRDYKQAVVLVSTDTGKGSGFHISGGYIVTNHHVIGDAAYVIVEFPEIGERFAAHVAGSDPELDIAVLRVDAGDKRLPYIEIERERDWEPGEHVYVIGNPLYLKQIAGEGTVLGTLQLRGRRGPVIAIDAPVHKGNSGSPVINGNGRAIAVIYATGEIEHQGERKQVGLAVPLGGLDALLPDLPTGN